MPTKRTKLTSRLNKTARLEIPVTPAFKQSVIDCAFKLGLKHSEFARRAIANAVQVECLRPAPQEQEQKGE